MTQQVVIFESLKVFHSADTSSSSTRTLPSGAYAVDEVLDRGDCTYARLWMGGWVCVRWKSTEYGFIDKSLGNEVLSAGGFSVPESVLVSRLSRFKGFYYDLNAPRYLETPVLGLRYPVVPPLQTNCCVFTEDLIVGAFRSSHSGLSWTLKQHEMAMVGDAKDPYSPPRAFVDAKMATASTVDPRTLPRPWSVCQGWRTIPTSGHTFIVLSVHVPTRKVCILEANSAYKMNGPGFRNIGDLDLFMSGPPAKWWELPKVPTWEQVCGYYVAGIRRSLLHVTSPVWGRVET